jgi:hypothetical protein
MRKKSPFSRPVAVYGWVGVGFLRRGCINLDLVWVVALLVCGAILLVI